MLSERQYKNYRLDYLNPMVPTVGMLVDFLNNYLGSNLELPNIAEIGKTKTFELEDVFYAKGIDFYSNNIIEKTFFGEYVDNLEKAIIILKKIANTMKSFEILFAIRNLTFLSSALVSKDVEKYKKLCRQFKSFSIEKDFKESFRKMLKDERYYIFTPGEYSKMLDQAEATLMSIGMHDLSVEFENEFRELAERQDARSKEYNDLNGTVSLDDDTPESSELRKKISTLSEEFKNSIGEEEYNELIAEVDKKIKSR